MCCSLYDENSANVDIKYARSKSIEVLGIRDYGDEGLAEFALSELIRLFHGFGEHQWSDKQEELTNKTLGIIGMGATGQMLASRAISFGMKVCYFNRTRKYDIENENIEYLPLNELLIKSDVISTHLPKHTKVLFEKEFKLLGSNKVFINTSLELTCDFDSLKKWLEKDNNYAIFDSFIDVKHSLVEYNVSKGCIDFFTRAYFSRICYATCFSCPTCRRFFIFNLFINVSFICLK